MTTTYRKALLNVTARLDQSLAMADDILREPGDAEIGVRAEELRELIVEMLDRVETKLEQGEP